MQWKKLILEPSTYRGFVWLLMAAGLALSPEQQSAIISTGAAIAGLIGVFFADR